MGKRKHYEEDEEDYLERKIRSLQRKKSKIRRRRRHYYSSSAASLTDNDRVECPMQEDLQNEESLLGSNEIVDLVGDGPDYSAVDTDAGGLRSVVVRAASLPPQPTASPAPHTPAPPHPAPPLASTLASADEVVETIELDAGILSLLGDEPITKEIFGPCIHKDIASRWSDILVNGMKEDVKNEIVKGMDTPDNLRLAQPPLLNPEIKAACGEHILKRDSILVEKQKLLATVISGVANTLSTLLTTDAKYEDCKNDILKSLSDVGRLLCHMHFSETQTRRNFLVPSLNKEVKDNIKDLKRDQMIFGKDLQESLKSIKAISKTGSELKPTAVKSKWQPRSQQAGPHTSKALNWRGQPPAAARPPPRQTAAKTNSARGGRRALPSPPPPPRRTSDRRAPRSQHRSARRY